MIMLLLEKIAVRYMNTCTPTFRRRAPEGRSLIVLARARLSKVGRDVLSPYMLWQQRRDGLLAAAIDQITIQTTLTHG
jgi:hypothetical protein